MNVPALPTSMFAAAVFPFRGWRGRRLSILFRRASAFAFFSFRAAWRSRRELFRAESLVPRNSTTRSHEATSARPSARASDALDAVEAPIEDRNFSWASTTARALLIFWISVSTASSSVWSFFSSGRSGDSRNWSTTSIERILTAAVPRPVTRNELGMTEAGSPLKKTVLTACVSARSASRVIMARSGKTVTAVIRLAAAMSGADGSPAGSRVINAACALVACSWASWENPEPAAKTIKPRIQQIVVILFFIILFSPLFISTGIGP